MELELGLKITHTRDDQTSSTGFRISKDPFGPLFWSTETDAMFILVIHLKGFRRENIEIEINHEGNRIVIGGRKPVQEMVLRKWVMWKKEVELREFRKVFRIPDIVNLDKIKARFDEEDGVLRIKMPKTVKGKSGLKIEEEKEEEFEEFEDVRGQEVPENAEEKRQEQEIKEKEEEERGKVEEGIDEEKIESSEIAMIRKKIEEEIAEIESEKEIEDLKREEEVDKEEDQPETFEFRPLEESDLIRGIDAGDDDVKHDDHDEEEEENSSADVQEIGKPLKEEEIEEEWQKTEDLIAETKFHSDEIEEPELKSEEIEEPELKSEEIEGKEQEREELEETEEVAEGETISEKPDRAESDESEIGERDEIRETADEEEEPERVEETNEHGESQEGEEEEGRNKRRKSKRLCFPLVAGSALLMSLIVIVVHLIRSKKK